MRPCRLSQRERGRVATVHGAGERDTEIWRVSPPPTPPHAVADLSESVMASSFAATLRGGGHAPTRERLRRVHVAAGGLREAREVRK